MQASLIEQIPSTGFITLYSSQRSPPETILPYMEVMHEQSIISTYILNGISRLPLPTLVYLLPPPHRDFTSSPVLHLRNPRKLEDFRIQCSILSCQVSSLKRGYQNACGTCKYVMLVCNVPGLPIYF